MNIKRAVAHLVVGLIELSAVLVVIAIAAVLAIRSGLGDAAQPIVAIPFAVALLAVLWAHKRIVVRLAPYPIELMFRDVEGARRRSRARI